MVVYAFIPSRSKNLVTIHGLFMYTYDLTYFCVNKHSTFGHLNKILKFRYPVQNNLMGDSKKYTNLGINSAWNMQCDLWRSVTDVCDSNMKQHGACNRASANHRRIRSIRIRQLQHASDVKARRPLRERNCHIRYRDAPTSIIHYAGALRLNNLGPPNQRTYRQCKEVKLKVNYSLVSYVCKGLISFHFSFRFELS